MVTNSFRNSDESFWDPWIFQNEYLKNTQIHERRENDFMESGVEFQHQRSGTCGAVIADPAYRFQFSITKIL